MAVLQKIGNSLMIFYSGIANLRYVITKRKECSCKMLFYRNIARSCGAFPITYPHNYPSNNNFMLKFLGFDYLFDYWSYGNINKKLEKNNSISVKTDKLGYFQTKVLPKIRIPFVLVSGDSDYSTLRYKEILKSKHLIHWFAQNNVLSDEKITSIPLGLDFHTLLTEHSFGEKRMGMREQESRLEKIRKSETKKRMKVFTNFHFNYTSERRRELHRLLRENPIMHFQEKKMPRTEMWKFQKEFAFNFSPIGNGLDCIRTWESLVLGQIPIVERTNTALDDMYAEFPIVVIDDVSAINERNMSKWYKKYSKMFNDELEEKLTNKYWIDLIKEKQ